MGVDSDRIREESMRRGITRLCHFTPSRKLAHIMTATTGLRPVADLESSDPDLLDPNDVYRADNRRDALNCSIEYPNIWMLQKVREKPSSFRDWAVLFISPR